MAMRSAITIIAHNKTTDEQGVVVEFTVPRMCIDAIPRHNRFPYISMVAAVDKGSGRGIERRSWLSTDDITVFE